MISIALNYDKNSEYFLGVKTNLFIIIQKCIEITIILKNKKIIFRFILFYILELKVLRIYYIY